MKFDYNIGVKKSCFYLRTLNYLWTTKVNVYVLSCQKKFDLGHDRRSVVFFLLFLLSFLSFSLFFCFCSCFLLFFCFFVQVFLKLTTTKQLQHCRRKFVFMKYSETKSEAKKVQGKIANFQTVIQLLWINKTSKRNSVFEILHRVTNRFSRFCDHQPFLQNLTCNAS